jgi:hypothetical protein
MNKKIKIQPKDAPDSDSVSDEEGQEDTLVHEVLRAMHVGLPHGPRDFLLLLRVPYGLPCRQFVVEKVLPCV